MGAAPAELDLTHIRSVFAELGNALVLHPMEQPTQYKADKNYSVSIQTLTLKSLPPVITRSFVTAMSMSVMSK